MSGNSNKPLTPQPGSGSGGLPNYYEGQQPPNNNAQGRQTPQNFISVGNDKSNTTKPSSTTSNNPQHSSKLNTVVRFGNDSFTIKGYITCNNKQFFVLECARAMSGYNGRCPECHEQHIALEPTRSYYATIDSIYEAIEKEKADRERSQGPKPMNRLTAVHENIPPLNRPILGKNKGIEGDSNSCYMDSTIFCMFAYTNIFDTLLNMQVTNNKIGTLQRLLKQNIVNVLRSEEGFVERDAMYHLRGQLSEATGDRSFKEMEKDPSEFLRELEKLFQYAPLKTIAPDQPPKEDQSNITTNIMWEMFDPNPQNMLHTNIAALFRNSLQEIPAKLATIPPFLILIAPRHTRTQRSYRYIIPDRQISLDDKMIQLACASCSKVNHGPNQPREFYSCGQCFSQDPSLKNSNSTDARVACYCSGCSMSYHSSLTSQDRVNHQAKQMKNIIHKLNLFAVLCIETSHYVAFVKCHKQNQNHEWLFFDSMSDRVNNNKNIPCVSRVADFDRWIDEAERNQFFFQDLDARRSQGKPTSQAFSDDEMRRLRLFRDGAFFFYENPNGNYQ